MLPALSSQNIAARKEQLQQEAQEYYNQNRSNQNWHCNTRDWWRFVWNLFALQMAFACR